MSVHSIHHINIRADPEAIERLKEFYCVVLGLTQDWRPPFASQGYWLYAEARPIVHLVRVAGTDEPLSSPSQRTAVDHIALRCSGIDSFLLKLEHHGVGYTISRVPSLDVMQVLIRDPVGTGIELSFDGPEGQAPKSERGV